MPAVLAVNEAVFIEITVLGEAADDSHNLGLNSAHIRLSWWH